MNYCCNISYKWPKGFHFNWIISICCSKMTHQKIAWETHSANCHIEINPYDFLKHECHVFRCHCVLLLIIEISFSISLVTTHHKIISFWPFAIFSPFIKLFEIHFPYFKRSSLQRRALINLAFLFVFCFSNSSILAFQAFLVMFNGKLWLVIAN